MQKYFSNILNTATKGISTHNDLSVIIKGQTNHMLSLGENKLVISVSPFYQFNG